MVKKFQNKDSLLEKIRDQLTKFDPIKLNDLPAESQMSRFDSKYFFSSLLIPCILQKAYDSYQVLEVNYSRIMKYKSDYYDTNDLQMYLNHHNGKRERSKIRIREYMHSGDRFLEIKNKSNKGFLKKERIPLEGKKNMDLEAMRFIVNNSSYNPQNLQHSLTTQFNRIMLISRNMQERITIDWNISLHHIDGIKTLFGTGIIEVKNEELHSPSAFKEILAFFRIHPQSISKYCIGHAFLNKNVKYNNFKPKTLQINKLENEFSEYNFT